MRLRVVTLNCWGIPIPYFGSKDRFPRIQEIVKELAVGEYDLVALQEIWYSADYDYIVKQLKHVLPNSFYFHSGVVGSGVCILTKGAILDTCMFRYSLNGYPHHIHRGDWMGGKVAGMAKIRFGQEGLKGVDVCFYTTHLHAEYDHVRDLYKGHRVVQAFEIGQFVKQTCAAEDLAIVTGDFNLEPHMLGYRIIMANAGLKDAWIVREGGQDKDIYDGNTSNIPENSYVDAEHLEYWPNGKRIDYICFRDGRGTSAKVESCHTAFHRVPGREFSYSDHEAVVAVFDVQKREEAPYNVSFRPSDDVLDQLDQALPIIDADIERMAHDRGFYLGSTLVLIVVVFYSIGLELTFPILALPIILCRFGVTLAIGFCIMNGLISSTIEKKLLRAAHESISVLSRTRSRK